jgi:hypothetical protein
MRDPLGSGSREPPGCVAAGKPASQRHREHWAGLIETAVYWSDGLDKPPWPGCAGA